MSAFHPLRIHNPTVIRTVAIRARPLIQIGLVVALVSAFTLATDYIGLQSSWNLLWMVGLPFAVARAFDGGEGSWGLAGLGLMLCGFATMIAVAAAFNLGP